MGAKKAFESGFNKKPDLKLKIISIPWIMLKLQCKDVEATAHPWTALHPSKDLGKWQMEIVNAHHNDPLQSFSALTTELKGR